MFDWSSIGKEAGGEVVERYFHETLSQYIKEGIANGDNTHNILFDAITRLRNSKTLLFIQNAFGTKATGLALTGIGAGIAAWMQKMDWGKFMPEEKNPVMHQIRFALQNLAPRILVGGAEALGDGFEAHVKASVSEIVSDDSARSPQKPGSLDRVAYLPPYGTAPADIFEYEYDVAADGTRTIRTDRLGLPCCKGAKFQALKQERIANVKRTKSKTTPGQKQKDDKIGPPRVVEEDVTDDEYKRLCFLALNIEDLPIADAIRRMEFTGTDPATISLLLRLTEPKAPTPSKEERLDDAGHTFQVSWALTMHDKPEHEQRKGRDLLSDLASRPSRINTLGMHFVVADGETQFSAEQIASIYEYVQTWMGATLTVENQIRHAFTRAKAILEGVTGTAATTAAPVANRLEDAIGTVAHAAGKIALASAIGFTALFAMFLSLVMLGAFGVSLTRPIEASSLDVLFLMPCLLSLALAWNFAGWTRFLFVVLGITTGIAGTVFVTADVMERLTPNEFATALVAGGGILACLELFSFTAIQGLLSLVTRFFPNLEKDWLVNKGRILIMFIAIHVGIFMVLLSVSTPWLLRLVICVPTFFALASQMGLSGYEFTEEARQNAAKTMRLFRALTLIVFLVTVIVLISQNSGTPFSKVKEWFENSKITQFVAILCTAGPLIALAVRWLHIKKRRSENGVDVEILRRPPNKWVWGMGFVLLMFLATWTWTGSHINAFFEKKTQASSSADWLAVLFAPPPVVQQGVSNPLVISQPVPTATPASSHVQQKYPVSHSRPHKTCESLHLSPELCARVNSGE
ncbi:MAG: hypothetical protein NTX72_00355 [Candidatus Uhrbacteria bacterium]|nr:hypothetical protein [Candidatus Uhrbacteria bacterium]